MCRQCLLQCPHTYLRGCRGGGCEGEEQCEKERRELHSGHRLPVLVSTQMSGRTVSGSEHSNEGPEGVAGPLRRREGKSRGSSITRLCRFAGAAQQRPDCA